MNNLITINDLSTQQLQRLVQEGECINNATEFDKKLDGKLIGLFFKKLSTRTQTAFHRAVLNYGGNVVAYPDGALQLSSGESLKDTGHALGLYLDLLVIRTNEQTADMRTLIENTNMPVINALCASEHPTQAIADLITIKESFGELNNKSILYVGTANNTMYSLALAVLKIPSMHITLLTPLDFSLSEDKISNLKKISVTNGSSFSQIHSRSEITDSADVIYTTRWASMGEAPTKSDWLNDFKMLKIDSAFMNEVVKNEQSIFMHDLPAQRELEVSSEVMDGERSVIWHQARNKMTASMVAITYCLNLL